VKLTPRVTQPTPPVIRLSCRMLSRLFGVLGAVIEKPPLTAALPRGQLATGEEPANTPDCVTPATLSFSLPRPVRQ
jgi:hypothetical protein